MITRILFSFAISMILTFSAMGYDYDFDSTQTKAENGDPEAQFTLGYIYYHGCNPNDNQSPYVLLTNIEVPQNIEKAFKWLSRSADKNNPNAEYLLATMYQKSEGTTQNYDQAIKLLIKSAKQNNTDALMALGNMYYDGSLGVKQSYTDSFKNYEQAANGRTWYLFAGTTPENRAEYLLANMYFDGKGTKQNYVKAMKYYKQSIENISKGITENTPEDKKWLYNACYKIGYLYDNGLGVDADSDSALRWYTTASNGGNADATYAIGLQYEKANDNQKAQEYFSTAYDAGISKAESKLDSYGIFLYGYKQYNKGNFNGAITNFKKSIDMGSKDGIPETYLGHIYRNGYGVTKNNMEALHWYQQGRDKGNTTSSQSIQEMNQEGLENINKLFKAFGG